jgi:signal transduction histidine kinase
MSAAASSTTTGATPVVLIVDESPANRAQLANHLANHRWTVREAESGRAGLERVGDGTSIVVVDEKLPDMTGAEFRAAIKARAELRRIPVIIISAENSGSSENWDEDAEIYLSKPINLQELAATMKGLFQLTVAVSTRQADEAELERKVLERTSSLREAINQMEEFSYTVSHDLRAPLRSIKGYAEVLANEHGAKLKGEAASFLERIIENGNRMERLVNDILTISRLSSTKVRLEPIDLNALLHAIVREYPNLQANIAQITIEPLPSVIGHESLCTQIFANLLGNAAKFVPKGRVPQIRVWAEPRCEYARLNVRDNGIGIAPEFHQKIFGMFERLDPENYFGGTGIGLAIVRRAAEKMNGRVGVESVEGQGSLFWVELPKATA